MCVCGVEVLTTSLSSLGSATLSILSDVNIVCMCLVSHTDTMHKCVVCKSLYPDLIASSPGSPN